MRESQNEREPAFDGVRGVAALAVFFVHFGALFHGYWQPATWFSGVLKALAQCGHAGVDVFFGLSGVLLYRQLIERAPGYWDFLAGRVARIYPAFLPLLGVYVCLSLALPSYSKLPSSADEMAGYVLANALLLPGLLPIQPLITVAWSLSYEMAFYLIVPSAVLIRRWKPEWRAAAVAMVAVAFLMACHTGWARHERMVLFASGMLAYEAFLACGRIPAWCSWLGVAAALGSSLSGQLMVLFPAVLLLVWSLLGGAVGTARLFASRPLRQLGLMSYSFYLTHSLALHALRALVDWAGWREPIGDGATAGLLLVALGLAVLGGHLYHSAVELGGLSRWLVEEWRQAAASYGRWPSTGSGCLSPGENGE